ncbi:MAG: PIN domain-containing protein [Nanoarchaeota archaeon]
MNGSEIIKIVIDTNVIFMAVYDINSKAGKIVSAALENKIMLFSTDTVKEEITRVLKRELNFSDAEINTLIASLPITWLDKLYYHDFISKTKVKHKADKPVEALSLALNCQLLSADAHFKNRAMVDKILASLNN